MAIIFLGLAGIAAILALIGVIIAGIVVGGGIVLLVGCCCVPCVIAIYRKWRGREQNRKECVKDSAELSKLGCTV